MSCMQDSNTSVRDEAVATLLHMQALNKGCGNGIVTGEDASAVSAIVISKLYSQKLNDDSFSRSIHECASTFLEVSAEIHICVDGCD
jgi:hypothetical protein